jgi:hypothetical protein
MPEQSFVNLLITALGGALAVLGGIFATYFTQVLNNRAERRKFVREKCEEVYLLAEQVSLWVKNENDMWWQSYLEEFEPENEYIEIYRTEYQTLDCPIDKLMMTVTLHLPELKTGAEGFKKAVCQYQDFAYYFREQGWSVFSGDIRTTLESEYQGFKNSHQQLKLLIEKTILKSWGIHRSRREIRHWRSSYFFIKRVLQWTRFRTAQRIESDEDAVDLENAQF